MHDVAPHIKPGAKENSDVMIDKDVAGRPGVVTE
tara:strand:- start:2151 stop:2252 length:102 start_codon:yes stop_codon:yes gene_type:complete